jgi:hypothetical protein
MDSAPHYFICTECSTALCPRCALDQSQIYKLLLTIDQYERDMDMNKVSFMKEGNLTKKGMGRLYRPWAERTFILDEEGTLGYYHNGEQRGAINVKGASLTVLRACEAGGRNFAFSVVSPEVIHQGSLFNAGELILAASSLEEAGQWCACLQLAIRKAAGETGVLADVLGGTQLGEEEVIALVRRPSASGGLVASAEAAAAKGDQGTRSRGQSQDEGSGRAGGGAGAGAGAGGGGAHGLSLSASLVRSASALSAPASTAAPPPSLVRPAPASAPDLASKARGGVPRRGTTSAALALALGPQSQAAMEMSNSFFAGVSMDKKFSSEGSYKTRLVWLDESLHTLNWSKQGEKSDACKYIDLLSVTACVRQPPKKGGGASTPTTLTHSDSTDAAWLEHVCVSVTVDRKQYVSREGAAEAKGGGIDLRFESSRAAEQWVEVVNALRSLASSIFTGIMVDKKFTEESNYKTRLIWLDEVNKTFNWSKESAKSDTFKSVDVAALTARVAVPKKLPLHLNRSKLEEEGVCVTMTVGGEAGAGAGVKGGGIDLRFACNDMARNFVETVVNITARAAAPNPRRK